MFGPRHAYLILLCLVISPIIANIAKRHQPMQITVCSSGCAQCCTRTPFACPLRQAQDVASTGSGEPAARYLLFCLYFVFSLCERKNEIQKEDRVPLRKITSGLQRTSCSLSRR